MSSDEKPPTLRSKPDAVTEAVNRATADDDGTETCSFCGRGPSQINALVTKDLGTRSVKICDLCVNAARAQLQSD